MDNLNEQRLFRIMTGKVFVNIEDKKYTIVSPDAEILYDACKIYEQEMYKNRFSEFLTDQQCILILVKRGLCSRDILTNMGVIDDRIEELKLQLYDNRANLHEMKKLRKMMQQVKEKQNEMHNIRYKLHHLTLHGYVEMIKKQYILYRTLYNDNNTKVWNNFSDINMRLLENVLSEYMLGMANADQIRYIARNEPWRSYWNINKSNPFNTKYDVCLTDEQRTLMMFSKMYDSIYEHPNRPEDMVINDDDLCDGWMIRQRKDIEEEKKGQKKSKTTDKLKKADEVFIMAENIEDARSVESLNDTEARIIKKQRENIIKQSGKAVDANFQDRRLQIQQYKNQMFMNTVKGR